MLERSTRLIPVRRNSRFGFSAGTEAAPITGAPAAHCCYMTAHRLEEYTVSGQIHHGYDPALDWKLTRTLRERDKESPIEASKSMISKETNYY